MDNSLLSIKIRKTTVGSFALLFFLFLFIYIEPLAIFNLKISHLYKLAILYILLVSFFMHRILSITNHNTVRYNALLLVAYFWALQPIIFSFSREYPADSFFIGGQRLFSIILFHWIISNKFNADTLFTFYNSFLSFTLLSTLPFLFGILEPLGDTYDITKFGLEASKSFIGVFQTSHNASLIMAMSGVGSFTLFYIDDNPAKKQQNLLFFSLAFFFLTIITYARAGWIAFLAGVIAAILFSKKPKKLFHNKKLWLFFFSLIVGISVFTAKYGDALLMRALGKTKYSSDSIITLNEISSGRFFIWDTSIRIFSNSSFLEKVCGIGEKELINRMYKHIGLKLFSHNGFINMLLSDGVIGFLLFLSLTIMLFRQIINIKNHKYKILSLSTFSCWLVHYFFQGGEFPIAFSLLLVIFSMAFLSTSDPPC